jgi:hypothetical protein
MMLRHAAGVALAKRWGSGEGMRLASCLCPRACSPKLPPTKLFLCERISFGCPEQSCLVWFHRPHRHDSKILFAAARVKTRGGCHLQEMEVSHPHSPARNWSVPGNGGHPPRFWRGIFQGNLVEVLPRVAFHPSPNPLPTCKEMHVGPT